LKELSMNNVNGQRFIDALKEVIDLLVENRIKLDALEQVFKETNPLVHELYLGEIEKLRERKARELNQALTASLKAKFTERKGYPRLRSRKQ